MSSLLIRCITIVTMLAAVVHAQCVVVCSLQSATQTTTSVNIQSGEHSCCPHQQDAPQNQNSQKPCPPHQAVIGPGATESSMAAHITFSAAMLRSSPTVLPLLLDLQAHCGRGTASGSSSLNLLSSISILRI